MERAFKEDMMKTFEMSDLGLMHYFSWHWNKSRKRRKIYLSENLYTENLLKKFKMHGCKSVATPLVPNEKVRKEDGAKKADALIYRSLIGSLLYQTATRPDIMFTTSLLSRCMKNPIQIHYRTAKRILRYLQGTKRYKIWYILNSDSKLFGYTDSDWAWLADDMKSTSGYTFTLGSEIFSPASKKHDTVAQSSAKAEYIVGAICASQAIWLQWTFEDMDETQMEPINIFCDSKSTIAMTKKSVFHSRTKHIAIKYHSLSKRNHNKQRGQVQVLQDRVVNIFTKVLWKFNFEFLCNKIGVSKECNQEESQCWEGVLEVTTASSHSYFLMKNLQLSYFPSQ